MYNRISSYVILFKFALLHIGKSEKWNLIFEAKGKNFFDNFTFVTNNDPTHGYVNYVNKSTAVEEGYIETLLNDDVYIGCDHTNIGNCYSSFYLRHFFSKWENVYAKPAFFLFHFLYTHRRKKQHHFAPNF